MMHINLLFLCALVCTITLAVASDRHERSNNGNSKSVFIGKHEADEITTLYSFKRPASHTKTFHYFSVYGYSSLKIHGIELRDEDDHGNNDWPVIVQGGKDNCFVEIAFSNKPEHGINFSIVLYTNNQISDIRRHIPHSSIDPNTLSKYNIVQSRGNWHKMLPPVRVAVGGKSSMFYRFHGPLGFEITRFEVLDDSRSTSHECIPMRRSGGIGTPCISLSNVRRRRKVMMLFL